MSKLVAFAAVFALVGVPAWAQNTGGTMPVPSAQNSGAGISGRPGNKNGPAPKAQTTGSSTGTSTGISPAVQQDSAKIPGKAGSKSGPAVKPPSK